MKTVASYCYRLLLTVCGLFMCSVPAGAQRTTARKGLQPASGTTGSFLFLSDVHLDDDDDTTCMGEDATTSLWDSCMVQVRSVLSGVNPPKFILYTGDLPTHGYKSAVRAQNIGIMLKDLGKLATDAGIPLIYAPGNNDALKGNYYPFSGPDYPTPFATVNMDSSSDFPYGLFGVHEPLHFTYPYMISSEHVLSGYWSMQVIEGLRIICMNTVIFGRKLYGVTYDERINMINQETSWLGQQLQQAKSNNQKVYLTMHIPPGYDVNANLCMWLDTTGYSAKDSFLTLVDSFKSTIAGIFYGHTHRDELRLLYDKSGDSVNEVAISCPAVSPVYNNYPSFKVVNFDATTMEPIDFTTYFHNVSCTFIKDGDSCCEPPSATWGGDTYSFSEVYHSINGATILNTLKHMDFNEIKNDMAETYKAGNGPSSTGSRGIKVTFGPYQ